MFRKIGRICLVVVAWWAMAGPMYAGLDMAAGAGPMFSSMKTDPYSKIYDSTVAFELFGSANLKDFIPIPIPVIDPRAGLLIGLSKYESADPDFSALAKIKPIVPYIEPSYSHPDAIGGVYLRGYGKFGFGLSPTSTETSYVHPIKGKLADSSNGTNGTLFFAIGAGFRYEQFKEIELTMEYGFFRLSGTDSISIGSFNIGVAYYL